MTHRHEILQMIPASGTHEWWVVNRPMDHLDQLVVSPPEPVLAWLLVRHTGTPDDAAFTWETVEPYVSGDGHDPAEFSDTFGCEEPEDKDSYRAVVYRQEVADYVREYGDRIAWGDPSWATVRSLLGSPD